MTDALSNPIGTATVVDLAPREWNIYLAGRFDGRLEGMAAGRTENARDWWRAGWLQGHSEGWLAADRAATIGHAVAHRTVQAMARIDAHAQTTERAHQRHLESAAAAWSSATPWPDEDPAQPWWSRQGWLTEQEALAWRRYMAWVAAQEAAA